MHFDLHSDSTVDPREEASRRKSQRTAGRTVPLMSVWPKVANKTPFVCSTCCCVCRTQRTHLQQRAKRCANIWKTNVTNSLFQSFYL